MDDAAGCLGRFLILLLIAAGLGLGGLVLTSKAVLYREELMANDYYGKFRCTYFTGTRSVELMSNSDTGCPRFIDVGS